MRLRFWLGYAVVAAIAIGCVAIALVVHAREAENFDQTQHSEAVRSARQAEALAALSVGQLSSAAAFYQAEGRFNRHEFNVMADSLLGSGALSATAFVQSVPGPARRRFERAHGYPILDRTRLGNLRREGQQALLLPARPSSQPRSSQRSRRRSATTSAPTRPRAADLLEARDTGRTGGDPGHPAAARRHRHQRLQTGLPRRRPDRHGRRAPRRAGRLRHRRLQGLRPGRGGDHGAPPRSRRAARRRRPDRRRLLPEPRRSRERAVPDRRPDLAAGRRATRTAPASACRC